MAQRLLLEGADIDELLERVRTEHGPDARIVHAEQKLVGGVAGFFARRRYEVAVAVDEPGPPAPATAAAPVPAPAAAPTTAPAQEATPVTTFDTEPQPGRPSPSSLEELLAMADGQDGTTRPAGRPLSTESVSFDHLVRDLVARAEPEQRQQPVPFIPAQGGFSASVPRVLAEPVVTALDAPATDGAAQGVAVELDLPALALPRVEPEAFGIPAHDLYPAAEFPRGTARFTAPVPPAAPGAPEPAPVPAAPVRQYVAKHSSRPVLVPQVVADLGLPVRELAAEPETDPRVALLDVLADLAVTAPSQLEGVQVVVGDAGAAHRLAAAWARTCGEGTDVVLLDHADEAAEELAAEAHRTAAQRGGALVVVDAGTTRATARRAARRVAALGASSVTAVVDARWDVATTREWLTALESHGSRVDELAAHGVVESPTPLRLLEAGVPVAWLDDQPATLGAWAAPCLDRWR